MVIIHGSGISVRQRRSIPSGLTVPSINAPNEACLPRPIVSLICAMNMPPIKPELALASQVSRPFSLRKAIMSSARLSGPPVVRWLDFVGIAPLISMAILSAGDIPASG